jgi:hypothetical protein
MRTLKVPVHYATTKRKIQILNKLTARLTYAVKRWSFFRMLQHITEKFNERGIEVKAVNERNTSKRCSQCGSLNTKRPKQSKPICLDCKAEMDADINGAVNIALCIRNAADGPAETNNDWRYNALKLEATVRTLRFERAFESEDSNRTEFIRW